MSDPQPANQTFLVTLSFGMPRQSRGLPNEAKEIEENAHAAEGVTTASAYYFKQKIRKMVNTKKGKTKIVYETIDALASLKAYNSHWEKEHKRLARIPWAGSTRLLPAALAPQYFNLRSLMEEGAPAKRQEFLEVYSDWFNTAPNRMGALFLAADFPSSAECAERIQWENTVMPLPDAQGWERMALINPEHIAAEASRTNAAVTRAREEGRRETWGQIIEHLNHIVTTLTKDKPRIYESLLGNLNSVLSLMPAYNALFNDAAMVQCAEAAREALGSITADDLREDPEVRARTVTAARDLLNQFGELGVRRLR